MINIIINNTYIFMKQLNGLNSICDKSVEKISMHEVRNMQLNYSWKNFQPFFSDLIKINLFKKKLFQLLQHTNKRINEKLYENALFTDVN